MAPERSQLSKYYPVLIFLGIPQLAINTVVIDVKRLSIALFTREIIYLMKIK